MKLLLAFVLVIANGFYSNSKIQFREPIQKTQHQPSQTASENDAFDKTLQLIYKLAPTKTVKGNLTTISGPSRAKIAEISEKIRALASESADSRAQVIQALIQVVDGPIEEESSMAHRWLAAVRLLADLNAIKAIDVLVKNITETGEYRVHVGGRPVVSALIKIGIPAIPKLIEALSNENLNVRDAAADTLAKIYYDGHNVIITPPERRYADDKVHFSNAENVYLKLIEVLEGDNSSLKGGAALALAWICTDDSRDAIEHAMKTEKDGKTLEELKSARAEMRRFCSR